MNYFTSFNSLSNCCWEITVSCPISGTAGSIKNTVEIQNNKIAHNKDGLAVINLLYWLEKNKRGKLSEIDIIETLSNFRKRSKNYVGPSFDTICGSGPNGAIIHYKANLKTNRVLRNGDLILIDSGGQYLEGTTDITRTIGFGKVDFLKEVFWVKSSEVFLTLVLSIWT